MLMLILYMKGCRTLRSVSVLLQGQKTDFSQDDFFSHTSLMNWRELERRQSKESSLL